MSCRRVTAANYGGCANTGEYPSQGRPMVARKAPSDVDALRQQGLPRERVGEHAKLRRFCKVGKVIQLSHPKFGGRYPKQKRSP